MNLFERSILLAKETFLDVYMNIFALEKLWLRSISYRGAPRRVSETGDNDIRYESFRALDLDS